MPAQIEDVMIAARPLPPETTAAAAFSRFSAQADLDIAIVVFDGAPVGLVGRASLSEALLRGGRDAARKPITKFMNALPPLVECGESVARFAKAASESETGALRHGAVVVKDGAYVGYAPASALLEALALENAARAKAMMAANRRLQATQAEAERATEEKARFLAMLGHEVRTPLTGVLGVADLLCDARLDDDARGLARTISASGRLLDRILEDMLDLSRMEAGKLDLKPEPFQLRDFARETRELWIGRAVDRNVSLRVDVAAGAEERLEADVGRLRQVLFNLVSNALKFTDAGRVTATLQTSTTDDGDVSLRMIVSDTGPGVSDADKARLFDLFERADDDATASKPGSGLGLAIAKGLVARMNGDLSLADNPGGGSIFTVEVPVRRAGPRLAIENAPRPRRANFQLGDILLVEDHAVSQLVIERALTAAGWRVDAVQTPAQAVRRADGKAYQAILIDMHLPDGLGVDVARSIIEGDGPNGKTPLLAVTADVTDERRQDCFEHGFSGFIEKPIRPRNLVAELADAVMAAQHASAARSSSAGALRA